MAQSINYSFTHYLSAKRTVDDRAINRYVWEQLASLLPPTSRDMPLQVLEVGAGIGTMIERILEWDLLRFANYTAIDSQPENIKSAQLRLEDWGRSRDMQVRTSRKGVTLEDSHRLMTITLEPVDAFNLIARERASGRWDLLIAHAFLDLVDVPSILPGLLALLMPGGLFYFSINFDGLTLLEPTIDPALDELIPILYHHTMDERRMAGKPSGDSRTGRRLFAYLKNAEAHILAAGASDWVIHSQQGKYPGDEAYFLRFIINTIHQALAGHPELDQDSFQAWIAERHAQIERGELVYIAHQIDILGITDE